jgi:hypothetical protein
MRGQRSRPWAPAWVAPRNVEWGHETSINKNALLKRVRDQGNFIARLQKAPSCHRGGQYCLLLKTQPKTMPSTIL